MNRCEMARPMPRMPPVTSATCPVMSAMSNVLPSQPGHLRRDSEDEGVTLAAAAAEGGHPGTAAAALEFQDQVQGDPGAGRADRVADRDGAAVDVDVVRGDLEVAHGLDGHR